MVSDGLLKKDVRVLEMLVEIGVLEIGLLVIPNWKVELVVVVVVMRLVEMLRGDDVGITRGIDWGSTKKIIKKF